MKKYMYVSNPPVEKADKELLIKNANWQTESSIHKIRFSTMFCVCFGCFPLLIDITVFIKIITVAPPIVCMLLTILCYIRYQTKHQYKSGYLVFLLATISMNIFLVNTGITFFILNVGFLSEIVKNSMVVAIYAIVLIYDILALHFGTVRYINDTLHIPKINSLDNGKNYIIVALAAIGGIIGISITRAGLTFIIAPFSIVAALYFFRIVTTAFATYVNLDMLCALKAELEEEAQGDAPPAEDDPKDEPT